VTAAADPRSDRAVQATPAYTSAKMAGLRVSWHALLWQLILVGVIALLLVIFGVFSADPIHDQAQIRTERRDCQHKRLGPMRLEADRQAPAGEQLWVVWLEADPTMEAGSRLSPTWPRGTTAIFAPELRILDEDGDVIIREGETFVSGGYRDGSDIYICAVTVVR
jgi:hypothetical protein